MIRIVLKNLELIHCHDMQEFVIVFLPVKKVKEKKNCFYWCFFPVQELWGKDEKKNLICIKNKNYGERRHYVSIRVSNSLLFFFLFLACIVLKALLFNLQLDLNINMIFLSSDLKVISIAKVWKYVQYQTDTNSTNMVISFQIARTHNLYQEPRVT